MQHAKSEAAFEEAKQYIPGGVNSPVRSFRSVGGVPPIIAGGAGSKLANSPISTATNISTTF